jgi:hypothetical protein
MTLAQRLLSAARGGGSIIAPPRSVFDLTASPYGGWTISNHPKAAYYNGKTYFSMVNGSTGAVFISSYDHAAQTTTTPVQVSTMPGVDTHVAPTVLVRDSDKRIMVALCVHGGSGLFLLVSTNPEDATSFGSSVNIDASVGASDYAFLNLIQLTGVANDPIYIFYRDDSGSVGRLAYTKSIDDGATWSARTLVMTPFSNQIGWAIRPSTNRIDVMASDRDIFGTEGAVDIGHMYMDGTDDKWYTSAGVEITAAKPFAHSQLTQLETNVTGGYPVDGISGANPVFTYLIDNGTTVSAKYARWDGSAWDKATIYTADHFTLDRFYGGAAINRADPSEVFSGIDTGVSTSELYSYTSADLGATWDAGTAVTTGSTNLNAGPSGVVNGVSGMPVIWLRGTISSSSSFTFNVKGLRRLVAG